MEKHDLQMETISAHHLYILEVELPPTSLYTVRRYDIPDVWSECVVDGL